MPHNPASIPNSKNISWILINSARKPMIPLDTAVILKIETEMIANILPKNFSGIFFCIIDTLEITKKGIPIPWTHDQKFNWFIVSIK